ncbi:MAG: hypothetical protein AAF570_21995, partial [Bacteroidota bacterium]
ENSFEKRSQTITLDYLEKLDGRLYREGQRYGDEEECKVLMGKIAAGMTKEELAREYPVFEDEQLPADKRTDLNKLLSASSAKGMGEMLQYTIRQRKKAIAQAYGHVEQDSTTIYKLKALMPEFYQQQGISASSIHGKIIEKKVAHMESVAIAKAIVVALVSIALAVVSMGTAVPGIVAAGAAAAGFGISGYQAYEELKNYTIENNMAEAGLMEDPSVVWLVIAVAGATLDLAAAAKAVGILGKAASNLDKGGEYLKFQQQLAKAREAGELDVKILDAAERAAKAKAGFSQANKDFLKTVSGKLYSNPYMDPEIYYHLVRMATFKAKEGIAKFEVFLSHVKQLRAQQGWAEMTPEELMKVKEAWREGRAAAQVSDEALEAAAGSAGPMRQSVENLIGKDARFALEFTDDELTAIVAKGRELGLTSDEIRDLIFAGSRVKKPSTAIEIMEQFNYYKEILRRGYPAKFKSVEDFEEFASMVKNTFDTHGLSGGQARVYGSSLTKATARNVDFSKVFS